MASENATTFFIVSIIIGFLLIRWLVSPSQTNSSSASSTAQAGAATNARAPSRTRRPVTQGMIEVVQSISPGLTVEQIRYDLERSGSVETTVERLLAEGTLPTPPSSEPQPASESSSEHGPATIYPDLIKRYNLESKLNQSGSVEEEIDAAGRSIATSKKPKWSQFKEERQTTLQKQREDMILRARRRLELQDNQKSESTLS
ncbi:hypothetical protein V1514DRAFT_211074 [Lipomyces japonicus]|uniref:uncharacterized protein n=1 Tax=Lipomyces japonicus TaxID=56871 RepID=UPI0034CE321D